MPKTKSPLNFSFPIRRWWWGSAAGVDGSSKNLKFCCLRGTRSASRCPSRTSRGYSGASSLSPPARLDCFHPLLLCKAARSVYNEFIGVKVESARSSVATMCMKRRRSPSFSVAASLFHHTRLLLAWSHQS